MPRTYKRKPGARRYKDYTEETLLLAIEECQQDSVKKVAERHNIPFRTLWNKVRGLHTKPCGGQAALSREVEETLVNSLLICAEAGMPLEKRDVKQVISGYLQRTGTKITTFTNNIPGDDWVDSFIKRHDVLTNRMCQNIKRSRAEVKPEDVQKYFTNLKGSLEGVPSGNIVNYDETNLSDEPGAKKCIFRRGVKYPERVMNFSKGNISLMFAGTAEGELLPPFVVYKSAHLYESWREGGPKGTRYARSKSGWFDAGCFEEWFLTIIVPWARRREGPKVMIGDNLSSHLSETAINKCQELNIRFVLLPPNSTDKCQPLDVSFFGPLKREWRKIMEGHKLRRPSSTSLEKDLFPGLLSKLIDRMGLRIPENVKAGFRACGISPFNMDAVLRKFPQAEATEQVRLAAEVSPALLEYLQRFKYSPGTNQKPRASRKRLLVEPGKSICADDLTSASNSSASPRSASRASSSASSDIVPTTTAGTSGIRLETSRRAKPAGKSISADDLTSESNSSPSPQPALLASSSASSGIVPTNTAGTSGIRPETTRRDKPACPPAPSDSDSDTSEDFASSEDEWHPPKKSRNMFRDFTF